MGSAFRLRPRHACATKKLRAESIEKVRMTETSRVPVLVVDNLAVQRLILKNCLLERGFQPIFMEDGEAALAALQTADAPRLMILDWELPGMSGIEVCRSIRSGQADRYTYILMLTSKPYAAHVVAGLESGADDVVRKPFDPAELGARLASGCRVLQLEEQLVTARDELHRLAMYDSLTGLLNRRAIIDFLQREMARASRQQMTAGVMILDLDHFKGINDTFGHLAGDQVLKRVGKLFQSSFRSYDVAGRFGGEEFLVVLPNCGYVELKQRAEMVRLSMAGLRLEFDGIPCSLTVSIGVTTFDPNLGDSLESLLQRADSALYEAKRYGRNRVGGSEAKP
jgi:two-component system cell cycle response regulator